MADRPSAKYKSYVVKECAQFSLEDDDDTTHLNTSSNARNDAENEPLTTQSGQTNGAAFNPPRFAENNRTPANWSQEVRSSREASRLTDEIDLDGDRDSHSDDDLDLLPSLPTNTKNSERKHRVQKFFLCLNPYFVRPRCTIL
ncbi:hypothetical protein M3Y94_00515100 [Aphelenchoides besseyi]|nr:hypothetical protein M3Y94_00515100 [Aphelenchoides besseyi]KAI6226016.1 hypothetical protein M3Y95_00757700 [Aphelenchoides besseyi]